MMTHLFPNCRKGPISILENLGKWQWAVNKYILVLLQILVSNLATSSSIMWKNKRYLITISWIYFFLQNVWWLAFQVLLYGKSVHLELKNTKFSYNNTSTKINHLTFCEKWNELTISKFLDFKTLVGLIIAFCKYLHQIFISYVKSKSFWYWPTKKFQANFWDSNPLRR